jgi:hypothetical protein
VASVCVRITYIYRVENCAFSGPNDATTRLQKSLTKFLGTDYKHRLSVVDYWSISFSEALRASLANFHLSAKTTPPPAAIKAVVVANPGRYKGASDLGQMKDP